MSWGYFGRIVEYGESGVGNVRTLTGDNQSEGGTDVPQDIVMRDNFS
jgi:hypothetical protein